MILRLLLLGILLCLLWMVLGPLGTALAVLFLADHWVAVTAVMLLLALSCAPQSLRGG